MQGTPAVEDRLLTTAEVAERLNVGERYIRRLVAERRIGYLKLGAKVRFTRDDVEAFVSSSRKLSVSTRRWDIDDLADNAEFLDHMDGLPPEPRSASAKDG